MLLALGAVSLPACLPRGDSHDGCDRACPNFSRLSLLNIKMFWQLPEAKLFFRSGSDDVNVVSGLQCGVAFRQHVQLHARAALGTSFFAPHHMSGQKESMQVEST